jgi:hypothetical protein
MRSGCCSLQDLAPTRLDDTAQTGIWEGRTDAVFRQSSLAAFAPAPEDAMSAYADHFAF